MRSKVPSGCVRELISTPPPVSPMTLGTSCHVPRREVSTASSRRDRSALLHVARLVMRHQCTSGCGVRALTRLSLSVFKAAVTLRTHGVA